MISRYVALIDSVLAGAGFIVFARVWLNAQDEDMVSHFVGTVARFPEELECHLMAGDCDFMLKVAVANLDAYLPL